MWMGGVVHVDGCFFYMDWCDYLCRLVRLFAIWVGVDVDQWMWLINMWISMVVYCVDECG